MGKKDVDLDLRNCDVGISCQEYTILVIAVLNEDLPLFMRERMVQHEKACSYHQSEVFHQSAISTPVTTELEQAAKKIIEKYRK